MRRRITQSAPKSASIHLPTLGSVAKPVVVGRRRELAALCDALTTTPVVVVRGVAGAGKTRLAEELLAHAPDPYGEAVYVRCLPGEHGQGVIARAERHLGALPGELTDALEHQRRLLIIDDTHNLTDADTTRTLREVARQMHHGRLVLFTRETLPLSRGQSSGCVLTLEGLDAQEARALWTVLEEMHGPTPQGTQDGALLRAGGLPLAIRREYARAAHGEGALDVAALEPSTLKVLAAVSVFRQAVPVAAVQGLVPDADLETQLAALVARQWIDAHDDGRIFVHDTVRELVAGALDEDTKRALHAQAARVSMGGAQDPSDWGAAHEMSLLDPVDRLREAVHHYVAAGLPKQAVEYLHDAASGVQYRGASAELVAIVEALRSSYPELGRDLYVRLAAAEGRVSEALLHEEVVDRVLGAELRWRAGEVQRASEALSQVYADEALNPDLRCRAAALLAEVCTEAGQHKDARERIAAASELTGAVSVETRARLQLALALVESRAGQLTSARVALTRASASERLDSALAATVDARRALCLALEGRAADAEKVLLACEEVARELGISTVLDETKYCRAVLTGVSGNPALACEALAQLVDSLRARGDEIAALRAEVEHARWLGESGLLSEAASIAGAAQNQCARTGLRGLAARAELVIARVDMAQWRLAEATGRCREIVNSEQTDLATQTAAKDLLTVLANESVANGPGRDEYLALLAAGASAQEDPSQALGYATRLVVDAERAGKHSHLARALAFVARLQMARGDRKAARASAVRATSEAHLSGCVDAKVSAHLVLASLAREADDKAQAMEHAREARALSSAAGLSVEGLVAGRALELVEEAKAPMPLEETAQAATMSEPAVSAAARWLADLGLTVVRPYRIVSADGSEKRVSEASPEMLQAPSRSLVIDGVREVIIRSGNQVADLRRRSLLKRLLFLFAARPGQAFSKEQIVEAVWEVDYHPLRHDAALFTNIMRIRRLLGADGTDLIRVSDDGYRFHPPKDFLFAARVEDAE